MCFTCKFNSGLYDKTKNRDFNKTLKKTAKLKDDRGKDPLFIIHFGSYDYNMICKIERRARNYEVLLCGQSYSSSI